MFFESKAKKNIVNYSIFWRVDRNKCWYLHCFCNFKKTWKAQNTVNRSVLATFGRRNPGISAVFSPVTAPNPCKLQHLLRFLNRLFALMNAKNAGIFACMTWWLCGIASVSCIELPAKATGLSGSRRLWRLRLKNIMHRSTSSRVFRRNNWSLLACLQLAARISGFANLNVYRVG